MDLHTVCSKGVAYKTRKRVGRGTGSGRGKTCGRGTKGQASRSGYSRSPGFEGGQMPLYRRMPKRGFTNARFRTDYTVINIGDVVGFSDGDVVDIEAILAKGLVSLNTPLLKILGNGVCSAKITIRAQKFSKSAVAAIEAAGGTVIMLDAKGRELSA